MLKHGSRVFTGLAALCVAFAYIGRENQSNSKRSAPTSALLSTKISGNQSNKYIPNIPVVNRDVAKPKKIFRVSKSKTLLRLRAGSKAGQLGISKEKDTPPMGPGAFVYLKRQDSFAILDNENNRVNFYPTNGDRSKSFGVTFPQGRQGLGLSANEAGEVVLLARHFDNKSKRRYPTYEIWNLANSATQWKQKESFSFSNRKTHFAAQALDMQSYKNGLLFRGIGPNEFHYLENGARITQELPGFPLSNQNNAFVKMTSEGTPGTDKTIVIQQVDANNKVKSSLNTNESIERLNNYRILPNGTLALDLEADAARKLPREVVVLNPQSGVVLARAPIRNNDDVVVDQDLSFQGSELYQLTQSRNLEPSNKGSAFEILNTHFEEDSSRRTDL